MATIAERWVEKGREEVTWDFVRNSLKEGIPIKTIKKITGLPTDEIKKMKEKMAKT